MYRNRKLIHVQIVGGSKEEILNIGRCWKSTHHSNILYKSNKKIKFKRQIIRDIILRDNTTAKLDAVLLPESEAESKWARSHQVDPPFPTWLWNLISCIIIKSSHCRQLYCKTVFKIFIWATIFLKMKILKIDCKKSFEISFIFKVYCSIVTVWLQI